MESQSIWNMRFEISSNPWTRLQGLRSHQLGFLALHLRFSRQPAQASKKLEWWMGSYLRFLTPSSWAFQQSPKLPESLLSISTPPPLPSLHPEDLQNCCVRRQTGLTHLIRAPLRGRRPAFTDRTAIRWTIGACR